MMWAILGFLFGIIISVGVLIFVLSKPPIDFK